MDTFQIWTWTSDSSFQVNKPVNCLSWCKSRNHPMSLAIGTDEDAEIWELSDSHVWEQRGVLHGLLCELYAKAQKAAGVRRVWLWKIMSKK